MISIAISTYNNLNYLKLLIDSIRNNTTNVDEIVIYAENCTDGTNEWLIDILQKIDPRVKIYIEQNIIPRGIGGGINFAVSKTTQEYIILLHSDMYLIPNYDTELFNIIAASENREKKLIVSSYRIEPNIWNNPEIIPGVISIDKNIFGEFYYNFNSTEFINWATKFCLANYNKSIPTMLGAGGYIIKKTDWDYLGGNDDIFRPACYDDVDLCLRAQIKGFEFITTMNTVCFHYGGRGSHFPEDKLDLKCERQIKAEHNGLLNWFEKWGDKIQFNSDGLIILTEKMKEYYLKNQNKFVY